MSTAVLLPSEPIPGVFEARQQRSVRLRDSFINAGIDALNHTRFSDLTVSGLAAGSGNSVGGFYTRFKDKNSYFRALRVHTIDSIEKNHSSAFNTLMQQPVDNRQSLGALVDLMVDIFTSRYRGVLRESLLLILEPDDPWAPMRDSAHNIVNTLETRCASIFTEFPPATACTRLRFCFQLIVGVLQNELVNNSHVFTTKDNSLREGLKETMCAYMHIPAE